jgi:hypothetical protein
MIFTSGCPKCGLTLEYKDYLSTNSSGGRGLRICSGASPGSIQGGEKGIEGCGHTWEETEFRNFDSDIPVKVDRLDCYIGESRSWYIGSDENGEANMIYYAHDILEGLEQYFPDIPGVPLVTHKEF